MKDWRSQAHVRWDCKYHVVICPKYRKRKLYGSTRRKVGEILRDLCRQKEIELVEGKAMPDHVHLLLSIPPKYKRSDDVGLLEGEECHSDSPRIAEAERHSVWPEFLVTRLLCEHRGSG